MRGAETTSIFDAAIHLLERGLDELAEKNRDVLERYAELKKATTERRSTRCRDYFRMRRVT